jgi:hypothetical protein
MSIFVWYPTGVAKDAEAASMTATTKVRASNPNAFASPIAMGFTTTAIALLNASSVRIEVKR